MIIRELKQPLQWMPQLYVAGDLTHFVMPGREAQITGRDLRQGDADKVRVYRRLDLAWYGWLHRRLHDALPNIHPATAAHMRSQFNLIWHWAKDRWHPDHLSSAANAVSPTYQPPAKAA